MENREVHTVYKVVANIGGKYVSSDVHGEAMLTYSLGEEIRSETPIFVFTSLIRARQYSSESSVLLGTSTLQPVPINRITPKLLVPFFDLTIKEALEFWSYVKLHSRVPSHMGSLITVANESYIVYDFTPIKEVR